MPKHIPKRRLHMPTNLAVVTLDGKDHYLGKHGSPASTAEYDRLVAEWLLFVRDSSNHSLCYSQLSCPRITSMCLKRWGLSHQSRLGADTYRYERTHSWLKMFGRAVVDCELWENEISERVATLYRLRWTMQPLSVAQEKGLQTEHARSAKPLQALAAEARRRQQRVAELVNAAYGLTAEKVALMCGRSRGECRASRGAADGAAVAERGTA